MQPSLTAASTGTGTYTSDMDAGVAGATAVWGGIAVHATVASNAMAITLGRVETEKAMAVI